MTTTKAEETGTELAKVNGHQKAVVLADERGLKFSDMESMWRFCTAVVNSGTFKEINSPEVALIRLQAGLELGLTPIWSLTNIMVTNGRPSVWGDALLGIVLNHPQCEDVIETFEGTGDNLVAICEVHRKGRLPVKREFSVADAKRAGLHGKSVHGAYPKRMLQMRARSWACRDSFADALRGLGVVEELRDVEPTATARVIERPKLVLPEDENQAAAPVAEPGFVKCDYFHDEPACDDPNCWVRKPRMAIAEEGAIIERE
jgi:hypothetical protein